MTKKSTVIIGIVVILIVITLSGLSMMIASTDVRSNQDRINQRLNEIDIMNNQLIEACNWDVPRGIALDLCDKQMKEAWDSSCLDQDMRESLGSCSKIKLYVEDRDII
jgi:hypothetical protein